MLRTVTCRKEGGVGVPEERDRALSGLGEVKLTFLAVGVVVADR